MTNIFLCLTANLLFDCTAVGQGGIEEIFIGSKNDFDVTVDTGTGEVTAVTPKAAQVFYKFEYLENTAGYTETFASSENLIGGTWTHRIEMIYPAFTLEARNRIQELKDCPCGLLVYFKDNNGNEWFFGVDPSERVRLTENVGQTGLALTDSSQEQLALEGTGANKRYAFTGTLPIV